MATSREHAELFELIFGDGAFEQLAKGGPDGSELSTSAKRRKHEKRQAQVGLASNVLGITAGAQGLYAASEDYKKKSAEAKGRVYAPKSGPIGRLKPIKAVTTWAKNPSNALKVAGGAVALQGANLVGDAVANRVLAREAKKSVKKSYDPRKKYIHDPKTQGIPLGNGQLVAVAVKRGPAAKDAVEETAKKTKALGRYTKDVTAPKVKQLKRGICKRIDDAEVTFEAEISKLDTDKRQVFGWASIVERDGVPVVDLQGDYISVDEIEKAAYTYVQKSRKGGNMHKRNGDDPHHVSDMIESFVVTPEKKEQLQLPDSMPTGWWVGYQVHDDETWQQIKNGERKAFSIHGRGKRKAL